MKLKVDKNGFVEIPMNLKQEKQIKLLEKKNLITAKYKLIQKPGIANVGGITISGLIMDTFMKITPEQFEIFKQDIINAGYKQK